MNRQENKHTNPELLENTVKMMMDAARTLKETPVSRSQAVAGQPAEDELSHVYSYRQKAYW